MAQSFALNTTLARNSSRGRCRGNPPQTPCEDDVFNTKTLLNRIGYYDEPSYGITPYPDGRLFQSIARFQKDHDLTVDGWMKPGGETERALQLVSRRGRPGLKDSDFGFPSADGFTLRGEIGKGHASAGRDVMMAKRAMGALGYYPKRLLLDPTDIVDRELHNGITQFQSDNKLYTDGWMGPGGETATAVKQALKKRETPDPEPEPESRPEQQSPPQEDSPKKPGQKPLKTPDPAKDKQQICDELQNAINAHQERLKAIESELANLDKIQKTKDEELRDREFKEVVKHVTEGIIFLTKKAIEKKLPIRLRKRPRHHLSSRLPERKTPRNAPTTRTGVGHG